MTSVACSRESVICSGELTIMTREQWRTKCRWRPRQGAKWFRSRHAVETLRSDHDYHRRHAHRALRRSLTYLIVKRRSKREHRPAARRRRYSPFDPHGLHGNTTRKGFRASARPPSTLRTPLSARHSRRSTTQNSGLWEPGDRSRWRRARRVTLFSFLSHQIRAVVG
jgi:hypothetical protein